MNVRMILLLGALGLGACGDSCYGRSVTGTIVSVGSRIARGADGTEEKVALRLKPYTADSKVEEVAGGEAGLDVECMSTRCSVLQPGECVALTCMYVRTSWDNPDIIRCKMKRTISCAQ